MRIHRVKLTDYRGVDEADIVLDPTGVTVIEGPNEVGKSSVAEAIRLIRGFRDSSRAKEIIAIKPVGVDAGPQVEIEVTTGPYHFTYRKRFLSKPSTELVVHAPKPEQRTGREADDRVEAIFGATLDPQLWDALQMVQGDSFQQPVLARIEPLRSALGSVAGSSGEGHQDLLDAIEEEYARYFTPMGRPKADYAALASRLQILESDLADLEEQEHDVRARLSRHERNEARLVELAAEESAAADELASLVTRRDRLSGLRDRLTAQEAALEHAVEAADEADRRVGERSRLVDELAERAAELESLTVRLDQADRVVADAVRRSDASQRTSDETAAAARRERDAYRDALDLLDRARLARELDELTWRERLISTAREQIEATTAYLQAHRVDEEAVDALAAAESTVLTARGAQEAAAARLSIRRLGASDVTIDGEGVVGDEEHAVLAETEIEVPGVVSITVTPGRQRRDLSAALAEAEDTWSALLREHGVTGVAEARDLARQRRVRQTELDRAEATLAQVLGDDDVDAVSARRRIVAERVGADPASDSPPDVLERAAAELREAADSAEERAGEAAAEAAVRERAVATAREDGIRLRQRAEHTRGDVGRIQQQIDDERARHADDDVADAVRRASAEVEQLQAAIAQSRRELCDERADELTVVLDNAEAVVRRNAQDRRQVENEQQQILGQLAVVESRGLQDRRDDVAAELEDSRRAYERMDARARAASLLRETMQHHLRDSQERYVAPFKQAVERLGRIVFGPDFAVEITADLAIESRTQDGATVPFASLSGGAKEQLAVIGRLACAQLVSPEEGAPVILDDSLGFSDPVRLGRLAAVLREVGRNAQIIILTCQPIRFSGVGGATTVRLPLGDAVAS